MQMIRQFIALLLLASLGVMIPTAISPVRVCRLESAVHVGGFESFGTVTRADGSQKVKCCSECGGKEDGEHDPCCVELQKLPDAPAPSAPVGLPPVLPVEIDDFLVRLECPVEYLPEVFSAAEPIRGPTSSGIRRALLGVWVI
jgi:hypothetical protein